MDNTKIDNTIFAINSKNRDKAIVLLTQNNIEVDMFQGADLKVELSYTSKLSVVAPKFNENDKFISDCYKIFKYNNSVMAFNFSDCERKTGITRYYAEKIYNKYLKEK
tara:strand:+ start:2949 stop:3272 length:324 start_codon:yes stop_codon:yes gene_type:complete